MENNIVINNIYSFNQENIPHINQRSWIIHKLTTSQQKQQGKKF
jgi:hypothetical protein